MRRKILPLVLGAALSIAAVAPAAAAPTCNLPAAPQGGGAAALVSLVQAVVNANVGVAVCDVQILNNSLNNLLQNADIHVLENILNNSPILSGFTITVDDVDVLNGIQINLLSAGGLVIPIEVAPAP